MDNIRKEFDALFGAMYLSESETALRIFELGYKAGADRERQEAAKQPEQYDQTALELCEVCGWKTLIPGDCCLNCERGKGGQQPVAWWNPKKDTASTDPVHRHNNDCVPLYLYGHPPKICQPLTDKEIDDVTTKLDDTTIGWSTHEFARAVERLLKEKNRG